jgi:hypothetical protein
LKEIGTLPAICLGEVVDFVAWIKHCKLSQIPGYNAIERVCLVKRLGHAGRGRGMYADVENIEPVARYLCLPHSRNYYK